MATDMQKTPSYLKGLAETRARAAGDLRRHTRQKAALETLLSDLEANLVRYRKMYTRVCEYLENAESDLESCDRLIRKFDGRLDPDEIEPIRAHKGRYGGHDRLREAIMGLLKDCHPEALDTEQVALTIILELDLEFATPKERRAWVHNSIGNSLKKMVAEGLVERMHDPSVLGQQGFGRWRWVPEAVMELTTLAQAAAQAGVGVSKAKRRGRPPTKAQPSR